MIFGGIEDLPDFGSLKKDMTGHRREDENRT